MGIAEKRCRILVVEDDAVLADGLHGALRSHGHAVHCVADGVHAFLSLDGDDYDLVILDLGLPRLDGLQLLQRIRSMGNDIPVIVVSARGDISSRVNGLRAGADDYLSKPFDLSELEARVESMLRRRNNTPPASIDPGLPRSGNLEELTQRELDIVNALKRHSGRAISPAQLIKDVSTGGEAITENGIQISVSRLRRKLRGTGITIRTARGLGYVLSEGGEG
jgi:two-component system OmpR family response regulator